MGLSFHCPQCSQAVPALPTQMGQQVTCTACGAQFRLSPMLLGGNGQSVPAKAPPVATMAVARPAAPPIAASVPPAATAAPPPPVAAVVKMPPTQPMPSAVPPPVAATAPSPRSPLTTHHSPATQQANVARFIAAVSQDSNVQLTSDGKLPELSLAEASAKKQKTAESSASPLVLGLALVASTVVSILLLVADFDSANPTSATAADARAAIAKFYIDQEGALLPYQQLLKDAALAHSLERYEDERAYYRRVLDLLRSESKNPYAGLTGTKSSDKELFNLIGTLLNESSR